MQSIKLIATKVKQQTGKNRKLFVSKIKLSDLARGPFMIDFYKRTQEPSEIGYQRPLSKKRSRDIKDFILNQTKGETVLPTPIVANSRIELRYEPIKGIKNVGFLYLHKNNPLYIIDGQHRRYAISEIMSNPDITSYIDYEIPINILSGFSRKKEVEQFYIINERQKRIKTDLGQRLLLQFEKDNNQRKLIPNSNSWQLVALKITDKLNNSKDSIWENKIILPDAVYDARNEKLISQISFVNSQKPLFIGRKAPFDENPDNIDQWTDTINDAWNAVAAAYPKINSDPQKYSLMKTVGVYSIHILLKNLLEDERPSRYDRAINRMEKMLKKAADGDYSSKFWYSKNVPYLVKERGDWAGAYSSAVGHRRIAAGLATGNRVV